MNKNQAVIMGIIFITSIYLSQSAFAQNNPKTDTQRFNTGYKDGLRNSLQNSKGLGGHGCDPTVPTDVVHTVPYQKGYAAGYSKGPCGSVSSSSSSLASTTSNSLIPGLIFPP
jgi:hypothetical protein